MKRPAFYFKLKGKVNLQRSYTDGGTAFGISGYIMRTRKGWPAWMDEDIQYLSEEYGGPDGYNAALMALEKQAFTICEKLNDQQGKIEEMIATHEANLKKLNLGYQLVGWFRGMGANNEST